MRKLLFPLFALASVELACRQTEPGQGSPPAPRATASTTTAPALGAAPSASAPATAGASATPPAALALDPNVAPDFGPTGAVRIEPSLPALVHGMLDHAERFGWSKDSREFGYCMVDGGAGATRCGFLRPLGKLEDTSDFDREKGEPNAARTRELDARIARYSAAPARWAYARDLELTWEVTIPREDPSGAPAKERVRLRAGARVRGSGRAALPIDIRGGPNAATIHPEAVLVSPDGQKLAVLSHDFGGEFSDHFELRLFDTNELAAQAYNAAGLELHERGAYAKAAELFQRAMYANPSAKLPAYNLACALARFEHPSAKPALELAISRGGDEVKKKAERDRDFDGVRTSAWFRALVR